MAICYMRLWAGVCSSNTEDKIDTVTCPGGTDVHRFVQLGKQS